MSSVEVFSLWFDIFWMSLDYFLSARQVACRLESTEIRAEGIISGGDIQSLNKQWHSICPDKVTFSLLTLFFSINKKFRLFLKTRCSGEHSGEMLAWHSCEPKAWVSVRPYRKDCTVA